MALTRLRDCILLTRPCIVVVFDLWASQYLDYCSRGDASETHSSTPPEPAP